MEEFDIHEWATISFVSLGYLFRNKNILSVCSRRYVKFSEQDILIDSQTLASTGIDCLIVRPEQASVDDVRGDAHQTEIFQNERQDKGQIDRTDTRQRRGE